MYDVDIISNMNDGIPELCDALYRQRVLRARLKPVNEKILLGGALFDAVSERMKWGIRGQFPEFDDSQVHMEFVRRLRLSRRLEQFGE